MIALPWLATVFVLRDCEFAYFTDTLAVQKRKGKREFIMSFYQIKLENPTKDRNQSLQFSQLLYVWYSDNNIVNMFSPGMCML